nr:MAG TPA: hypothetical protein [Caudoviricetes sp.]
MKKGLKISIGNRYRFFKKNLIIMVIIYILIKMDSFI